MSEEKLVPKLRFSGFDDEWNEVKLGDISTFLDNKRIPLKEDDRKQIKGEYPYYGASGIIDYVNDYIFDEELILMGEDGANIVTRSSKLIFLAKGKYWVNNHAHVIKADNNINQYFLSESLERINYEKYNTGTAQPKLNREVCQKIKVKIPQFNEQNKIANFLLVIDEKLRLLEQKYQYYQNFKKYLMQQIFTQKLRFDFSDEWKIVKLESLIKKGKAGGTPSSTNSDYYNGDIPFLSIRDMTDQGKYIVKTEKTITEEGLNNSSAWIIPKNSLLYSIYASIGLVAINRSDISTSQAIYGIILKDGVSLEYMYYYLTYFKKNIHKYIETGTQGNLNAKLLKSFEILLPSLGEQEMIVNVLSIVDEKIENSKKEIEKINEFKKGLLQQMFIYHYYKIRNISKNGVLMKTKIITNIQTDMKPFLDKNQLKKLENTLKQNLEHFDVIKKDKILTSIESKKNQDLVLNFLSAKQVEGCSQRTVTYYRTTIIKMLDKIKKKIEHITTDDLRTYLANYKKETNSSKITIDNVRRVLSSFFSWLEDEDYIVKNPVRRIHKIKTRKTVKEVLTDENFEILRDTCTNIRDLAMVELLNSTGIRVGELVNLNIDDVFFNERECIVLGKGDSERTVYFDAKTKIHLMNYLETRKDENPALFVSFKKPYNRLGINGIERRIRELGKQANIKRVHPHKFRRTMATNAIDKGMPIEQVQKLLGHVQIDTTMHYAMVNQNNVKNSHRKYLS